MTDPLDPLARLEAAARNNLTEDDIRQLHLIIDAYRGWQVLGRATKWFVVFLASLAGFFMALGQLREVLKSWVQ